jgi:Seryl-tRNA synthetase
MLSRQYVRSNPDTVRDACEKKGVDVDVDRILEIDEEWRELKSHGDDLRHEQNEISAQIGQFKQAGEETKAEEAIEQSQTLKDELEEVSTRADELETRLKERLLEVPGIPHESVPAGVDEQDNIPRRREGFDDLRELPTEVIPHYDLGEELEILDFDRATKTSGAGFYFLRGDGAQLQHALIQFMLDVHREQGYQDLVPPIPVRSAAMEGTGQFPKFVEDAYRVGGGNAESYDDDDLWLLPTAEVPVTNMHRDEILLDDDLPLKYQAHTPNFRREAGDTGLRLGESCESTSLTKWNS